MAIHCYIELGAQICNGETAASNKHLLDWYRTKGSSVIFKKFLNPYSRRMGAMQLCHHHDRRVAKKKNWASGVMFDRPRLQLTGKEVVSHSSISSFDNVLFPLLF